MSSTALGRRLASHLCRPRPWAADSPFMSWCLEPHPYIACASNPKRKPHLEYRTLGVSHSSVRSQSSNLPWSQLQRCSRFELFQKMLCHHPSAAHAKKASVMVLHPGDILVIYWWYTGHILVICWWYTGDILVIYWWYIGGILAMYWWYTGDILVVHYYKLY